MISGIDPIQCCCYASRLTHLFQSSNPLPLQNDIIIIKNYLYRILHTTCEDKMPGEVYVKKSSEINAPSGGQTEGMIRMNAITDMSDQICGTGISDTFEGNTSYALE